jgi:hypothetical protein
MTNIKPAGKADSVDQEAVEEYLKMLARCSTGGVT